MNHNLSFTASITINANLNKVWDALTKPEQVKKYLFGTEMVTDWKPGGDIIFQGEWEGKQYKDKGIVKKFEEKKSLEYTYFSGMSGMEDQPENYILLTFDLSGDENSTTLKLTQKGASDQTSLEHSKKNWETVLNKLKEIAEE